MPGTPVQISQRSAPSRAAKQAAEASDPPRPSRTTSPSELRAMKPWVTTTSAFMASSRRRNASSRSQPQLAER